MTDTVDGPEIIELDRYRETDGELEAGFDETEARKYLDNTEIIEGGGWREDEKSRPYWLTVPQLIEFEKNDRAIKNDRDFWQWFKEFRKGNSVRKSRGRVSWFDNFKGQVDEQRNYLRDWWGGWGYSSNSSEDQKLAIALRAIQTTVSVVNNTGKRYRVEFASDAGSAPLSATSYEDRLVIVSPQALLDGQLAQADGIEVTSGWGLHEASHIEYSEGTLGALREPDVLRPLRVAQLLHNVLEDLRIERLTSRKFPGFEPYFDTANKYLWSKQESVAPTVWGPSLMDKLNAVILMAKWPVEYKGIAEKDQELRDEFIWWRQWADDYIFETKDLRTLLEEGLKRLAEDPDTANEMQEMTEAEKETEKQLGQEPEQLSDEEFEELLKQLKDHLGKPNGGIDPCPSPLSGRRTVKLSKEQAKRVNSLVQEEFTKEAPKITFPNRNWTSDPEIITVRPQEDATSKMYYQPPQRSLVDRMKSVFFFRKHTPQLTDRMLKTGMIDDEELWRVGTGDYRVFEQRTIVEDPKVQVTMLIDMSGSMSGSNITKATTLATVMLEVLRLMKGARVRVRSHTNQGNDSYICRLWEPGDPMTRIGLLQTQPHGCNWDGYAIQWCAEEMVANQLPDEQMVLIVLSDGRPNGGHSYSGTPAMDHVRQVTDHYARKGVQTIQIAIDPAVQRWDQERMYEHFIEYRSAQELPMQLTRLFIKLFGAAQ